MDVNVLRYGIAALTVAATLGFALRPSCSSGGGSRTSSIAGSTAGPAAASRWSRSRCSSRRRRGAQTGAWGGIARRSIPGAAAARRSPTTIARRAASGRHAGSRRQPELFGAARCDRGRPAVLPSLISVADRAATSATSGRSGTTRSASTARRHSCAMARASFRLRGSPPGFSRPVIAGQPLRRHLRQRLTVPRAERGAAAGLTRARAHPAAARHPVLLEPAGEQRGRLQRRSLQLLLRSRHLARPRDRRRLRRAAALLPPARACRATSSPGSPPCGEGHRSVEARTSVVGRAAERTLVVLSAVEDPNDDHVDLST